LKTVGRNGCRLGLVLVLGVALACRGGQESAPPTATTSSPGGSAQPNVTLFYPSADGLGFSACPVHVPPQIGKPQSLTALVRRYLDGPTCEGTSNPFPEGTQVRAVFLLDGGVAVVDLSSQARSGGGTDAEELRIYGLVDTITYNYPSVEAVQFLVDGQEVESLLGHLDISRPLPANLGLMPAEAKESWRKIHGGG
jgi:germination protein M